MENIRPNSDMVEKIICNAVVVSTHPRIARLCQGQEDAQMAPLVHHKGKSSRCEIENLTFDFGPPPRHQSLTRSFDATKDGLRGLFRTVQFCVAASERRPAIFIVAQPPPVLELLVVPAQTQAARSNLLLAIEDGHCADDGTDRSAEP